MLGLAFALLVAMLSRMDVSEDVSHRKLVLPLSLAKKHTAGTHPTLTCCTVLYTHTLITLSLF